ncbi:MAG: GTP pyrophosphokinase [Acidobacteria bacterium]|nr:GTP pyrophosphokinase [Acidobacteriota bacterium]
MSTLERAISLAALAHEGQVDKAGAPYILHVLRVMLRVGTPEERMVAVMHDMVEDCGWTPEKLRAEGFSEAVVNGVDAVTRRESETYEEFVLRAKANSIGRAVKMADLLDNADTSRLPAITERDKVRLDKYRRAIEVLQS